MLPDATLDTLAALVTTSPPRCGASRVVCVDGPAGSGKTTLADALGERLGAPVVHMDDLYEGWEQQLGAALAARVEAWLLLPWSVGLPGRHLRFDWARERFTTWVEVPAAPVLVLEGCASASALLRRRASVVVWVEAAADVRLHRGLERDGHDLQPHWRAWQEHEAAHFWADGTRAAADVVVDGTTGRVTVG